MRGLTIVDSYVNLTVAGSTLSWQIAYTPSNLAQDVVILYLEALLMFGAPGSWFARVRVRLMGRSIFSNSAGGQLYLDGQTFGQLGPLRADGSPSVGLQFPSGNGEKASDFESWFYLAPELLLLSITVNFTSPLTIETNLTATAGTPNSSHPDGHRDYQLSVHCDHDGHSSFDFPGWFQYDPNSNVRRNPGKGHVPAFSDHYPEQSRTHTAST